MFVIFSLASNGLYCSGYKLVNIGLLNNLIRTDDSLMVWWWSNLYKIRDCEAFLRWHVSMSVESCNDRFKTIGKPLSPGTGWWSRDWVFLSIRCWLTLWKTGPIWPFYTGQLLPLPKIHCMSELPTSASTGNRVRYGSVVTVHIWLPSPKVRGQSR